MAQRCVEGGDEEGVVPGGQVVRDEVLAGAWAAAESYKHEVSLVVFVRLWLGVPAWVPPHFQGTGVKDYL
ncbi:hypothetical protein CS8_078800 [Cupriavidus sp. 8B]